MKTQTMTQHTVPMGIQQEGPRNANGAMRTRILIASVLVLTILCLMLAVVPASAQSAVAPTARQEMASPDFAARMAAARAANKSRAPAPSQTAPALPQDLAQSGQPELRFVTPTDGDVVAGTNLLIWVADTRPFGVPGREVLFQWSSDGSVWNTIPLQESPDFGRGSYTTTVDTTTLPSGPLYLRASASPLLSAEESPATILVNVQQPPKVSCLLEPTGEPGGVAFDCSASRSKNADGVLREYKWDFGDGSSMVTHRSAAKHSYAFGRTYTFRLSVTDNLGLSSSLVKKVEILADGSASLPAAPQGVLYENGPVNGTVDAWTINFGYVVSDSLTLTAQSKISGFEFYVWEFPGDVLTSVDWLITSAPNGGTVYGSGTASGMNLTDQFISTNQFGYDVDHATVTGLSFVLPPGTYYLNLQNAAVPSGDPVFWDENSGVGCNSPGCPSQAMESSLGTIPSESFEIDGGGKAPCDVEMLTINATGQSQETDPQRKAKVPLGPDPDYVSLNFEVVATLTSGSDPAWCPEGQTVAGTTILGHTGALKTEIGYKQACSAGVQLANCVSDAQCNNPGKHDGVCTKYPFSGRPLRGNDDYKSPEDEGVKTHDPTAMWLDMPGFPDTTHAAADRDLYFDADFLSTMKGDTTNASCHFQVFISWDNTAKEYWPYTFIDLLDDSVHCKLND